MIGSQISENIPVVPFIVWLIFSKWMKLITSRRKSLKDGGEFCFHSWIMCYLANNVEKAKVFAVHPGKPWKLNNFLKEKGQVKILCRLHFIPAHLRIWSIEILSLFEHITWKITIHGNLQFSPVGHFVLRGSIVWLKFSLNLFKKPVIHWLLTSKLWHPDRWLDPTTSAGVPVQYLLQRSQHPWAWYHGNKYSHTYMWKYIYIIFFCLFFLLNVSKLDFVVVVGAVREEVPWCFSSCYYCDEGEI